MKVIVNFCKEHKGEKEMSEYKKETACTICDHRDVCKYKLDYLKILETINNTNICFETDDGKHAVKKVTSYDFIREINVPCKYFFVHTVNLR